ncbi:MAG: hypothetical protein JNK82_16125 [Myxococcaceae bacterium]|nr:hypothetical protein [Myxococcaceae bacterium]
MLVSSASAGGVEVPQPRVAVHPMIAIGVEASSLTPLQDAFRVSAAREQLDAVASFEVREALADAPESCVGDREPACFAHLAAKTGADWLLVPAVKSEPASYRLSVRVVEPNGRTFREASQSLKRAGRPSRPDIEAAFTALLGQLDLASVPRQFAAPAVVEVRPAPPGQPPAPSTPFPPASTPAPVPALRSPLLSALKFSTLALGAAGTVSGGVLLGVAGGQLAELNGRVSGGVFPDDAVARRAREAEVMWVAGQVALTAGLVLLVTSAVTWWWSSSVTSSSEATAAQ